MKRKGTYYDILGVSRNATSEEIKESFRKLSKIYHPDINKSPTAHEEFVVINEAYQTLINDDKRREYDNKIGSGTGPVLHICAYCKRKIEDMPYRCTRCSLKFCSDHRLPENHRCERSPPPVHRCKKCGRPIPPIYNYCRDCMPPQSRCRRCGKRIKQGYTLCRDCVNPPPENRCKRCGKSISRDKEYCKKCEKSSSNKILKKFLTYIAYIGIFIFSYLMFSLIFGGNNYGVLHDTTTTSTIAKPILTVTTLKLTTTTTTISRVPKTCDEFCKWENNSLGGVCATNAKLCQRYKTTYAAEANELCPKTLRKLDQFCCCTNDDGVLKELDNLEKKEFQLINRDNMTCAIDSDCGEIEVIRYCEGKEVYESKRIPTCLKTNEDVRVCASIMMPGELVSKCGYGTTCNKGECKDSRYLGIAPKY